MVFKILWGYLGKTKKLLTLALGLAAINTIFSLLDPQIFRILVDNYASKVHELDRDIFLRGVILLLLATVGVAFISRVAKNFQDYFVSVIEQRLGTKLYSTAVEHSFSLPYAAFEDQRSGELLLKLQKARTDSQQLLRNFVNMVFLTFVGILFVIVYAFTVHWSIGAVYIAIIPILGAVTFGISRKIKNAQKAIVLQSADLAGSTTETLRNVALVKSLGLEGQEISRLNSVNEEILQLELAKIRKIRWLMFLQGTFVNALRSSLMLLMLWLIFQRIITLGEFFSLLFYSFFIFTPLAELGAFATSYQEARASTEQLETVLKTPKEEKSPDAQDIGKLTSIAFENVTFKYASAVHASLENATFTIPEGATVAFVGPSGAGKSTVMKLVAGLYRPTNGSVLLNGTDMSKVDFTEYRRRIGLVAQETQLFAGTIRENLLFVKPDATDEECLRVLNAAQAMNILERAEKGLDTKIGEGGIKVSGGERQRLAIARALLRNPDLLIFDEATSSLDSITEKAITETIREIEKSRPSLITILVAHRLSTVAHADTIYVLERGKIVEYGNHADLLAKHGLYAALWREQQAASEPTTFATQVRMLNTG